MMDKENRYYIVHKGTNCIERISDHKFIGEKAEATERAKRLSSAFKEDLLIMPIREYEDKFTEREPDVKKEPASNNLYSTRKHLLGIYNNIVIVISSRITSHCPSSGMVNEKLSIEKVITDSDLVTNIQDYMKYTGQFKKHAEELIESAT